MNEHRHLIRRGTIEEDLTGYAMDILDAEVVGSEYTIVTGYKYVTVVVSSIGTPKDKEGNVE